MPREANTKYTDPKLQQRIIDLRENENYTWEAIKDKIGEEFDIISPTIPAIKTAHNSAMATTITVDKRAGKKFDLYTEELEKMYGKTIKILSKLVSSLESVYEEFEASDMEKMQKYLMFIKLSPQIKQTTEQILAYIKHHEEQQDKIRVEQKRLIYSTEQIKEKIDIYLKELNKQGFIKILKTLP